MSLVIYSFLFFFLTVFAKGIEMAIYQRKHLVETWSKRERIQGRFTGAKVYEGRLDDGRVVDLDTPSILIVLGFAAFCILGLAALLT